MDSPLNQESNKEGTVDDSDLPVFVAVLSSACIVNMRLLVVHYIPSLLIFLLIKLLISLLLIINYSTSTSFLLL